MTTPSWQKVFSTLAGERSRLVSARAVLGDHSGVPTRRRALVDHGGAERHPDGTGYRRVDVRP